MMRWAEVSSGTVTRITVSETEDFGAEWLNTFIGGAWVEIPEDVIAGPGFQYFDGVFIEPPVLIWDEGAGDWVAVETPGA